LGVKIMMELPTLGRYILDLEKDEIVNDIVIFPENTNESLTYFSIFFNRISQTYFFKNDSKNNDVDKDILIQVKNYFIDKKENFIVGDYQFGFEINEKDGSLKLDYGYIEGNKNTK